MRQQLSISLKSLETLPGAFNVEATNECPVLRIIVHFPWLHKGTDVCFSCHLVQWRPCASCGDLSGWGRRHGRLKQTGTQKVAHELEHCQHRGYFSAAARSTDT